MMNNEHTYVLHGTFSPSYWKDASAFEDATWEPLSEMYSSDGARCTASGDNILKCEDSTKFEPQCEARCKILLQIKICYAALARRIVVNAEGITKDTGCSTQCGFLEGFHCPNVGL
jgi:hypothetical protein